MDNLPYIMVIRLILRDFMDISEFKDANRRIFKDKMIVQSIDGDTISEKYCKNIGYSYKHN